MPSLALRGLPIVALAAVAVTFYVSGAAPELTPAGLAEHGQAWRAAAARHPLEALALYVPAFAVLAAAGLPVAMVLTLAGGMLFGPVLGALAAAAGAGLAALLGYAAVRSLLGAWVAERLRRRWPGLAQGIELFRQAGFWPVVGARLLPVMPFALVNVAAAAAQVPLRTFLTASVLGGLPSAFILAALGWGLAGELATASLAEAARSPRIWGPLLALSLLALLPAALARRRAAASSATAGPNEKRRG